MNLSDTLTTTLSDGQKVTLPLPYYAYHEGPGWSEYYAITNAANNMRVSLYKYGGPAITYIEAGELHPGAMQCSESVFKQAYTKAQLQNDEYYLSACPSVKVPSVSVNLIEA